MLAIKQFLRNKHCHNNIWEPRGDAKVLFFFWVLATLISNFILIFLYLFIFKCAQSKFTSLLHHKRMKKEKEKEKEKIVVMVSIMLSISLGTHGSCMLVYSLD